jgi:hypothetical protein
MKILLHQHLPKGTKKNYDKKSSYRVSTTKKNNDKKSSYRVSTTKKNYDKKSSYKVSTTISSKALDNY